MLADPRTAPLSRADQALVGLASVVSEAPWTIERSDLERARAAGLSDVAVVQAVGLSAFFNYLNRVADAVDIAFDYPTPLPPLVRDRSREPLPRPERARWPAGGAFPLSLADRPVTAQAFAAWRAYQLEREAPLSRRERAVIVRAVAETLCDARTYGALADAVPRGKRESALAAYAARLSAVPWKLAAADLDALRAVGLDDDRALLDAIAVASFQTTASRLALCFASTA